MGNIEKETQDFINKNNRFTYQGDSPQKFIKSGIVGINTFGMPNTQVNIKKVKNNDALMYPGKVVFDAVYTFNEDGVRNTTRTEGDKNKLALFFGDAQMFGEGLNDNETLAYYFENLNPNYTSKNYAFLGHGPSHMLYRISTDEFKKTYDNKSGKVFFLLRDDAIKTTVGEIPWGEGYPKYEILNGKLEYAGSFGGADYRPDSMYLPSMFTEKDFKTTLEVFKETKNNLPDGFELTVVVIPLTFSHYKMQSYLEKEGIKVINLYYTDLEYHTNRSARFLDGVHTKYSNQVIAKRITDYIDNNTVNYELPFKVLSNKQDILDRLKFETLSIPSMVDFPDDDAGVIISNVLKEYLGNEELNTDKLMEYMKKIHIEKIELVDNCKKNNYINSNILSNNFSKYLFEQEYIELEKKLKKYAFSDKINWTRIKSNRRY